MMTLRRADIHVAPIRALLAALDRDLTPPSPLEQELVDFLYDNRPHGVTPRACVEYIWAVDKEPVDPIGILNQMVYRLRQKGFVIEHPVGRMRLIGWGQP